MNLFWSFELLLGTCSQIAGLLALDKDFKSDINHYCAQFKLMVLGDYSQTHANEEIASLESKMDYWISLIPPRKYWHQIFSGGILLCLLLRVIIKPKIILGNIELRTPNHCLPLNALVEIFHFNQISILFKFSRR